MMQRQVKVRLDKDFIDRLKNVSEDMNIELKLLNFVLNSTLF